MWRKAKLHFPVRLAGWLHGNQYYKKRLLHIVLSESAAVIFKIKRIIKQFKKSHPDIIIVNPKPLSRKTQGLFLCLEVSILLFRTITIIITIVF